LARRADPAGDGPAARRRRLGRDSAPLPQGLTLAFLAGVRYAGRSPATRPPDAAGGRRLRGRRFSVLGRLSCAPPACLLCLRGRFERYSPPRKSFEGREDLRGLLTFTIDPETAKDFDDAISVQREGDGFRVWVHIADVSYFVRAGMPLDRGAAERAFTFYVP